MRTVKACAAVRAVAFSVEIDARGRALQSLALKVVAQIRAERRRYGSAEVDRLWELFGPRQEWGRSVGPVPWERTRLSVGPFASSTNVELILPAAFDRDAAAGKYLAAIEDGVVPVLLLFSGTVSWHTSDGRTQTAMVPWDREAAAELPIEVWREASGETRPGARS